MMSCTYGMGAAPRYTQQSNAKNLQMKTLSYSKIKYTPTVPIILTTIKKIERENFDFVLFFFFLSFFLLFPSHIAQKVYIYETSAQQMTALLLETILLLVRAACELRSLSCGSIHILWTLFYIPFCAYLHSQIKK